MEDSILKLCLAPTEIFWGDKNRNIEFLENIFRNVHEETDLIVLPEMFSTGFPSNKNKEEFRELAERNTGKTIELLKQFSSDKNLAVAGSFIADSGGLLFNRAFFIEPSGDEYFADKRHLFSLGGEDKIFKTGDKRLSVRFRGWNISMIICYDLRFPVWCRNCNLEYDLMIAIANWPDARIDTWDTLLKARAIENESYVCGVNCKGIDNMGCQYNGSSHVFDYKGKDIVVKANKEGLLYSTLSMKKLNRYREKFPFWKDNDSFNLE